MKKPVRAKSPSVRELCLISAMSAVNVTIFLYCRLYVQAGFMLFLAVAFAVWAIRKSRTMGTRVVDAENNGDGGG